MANEGIIIKGGTLTAGNLAVGRNARIVDNHIGDSHTAAPREIATDAEITAVAAHAQSDVHNLREWAGADRATLAIVFTDVVDSTKIGEALKDEAFRAIRLAHFARSRDLIAQHRGLEVKTIGDSFMVVFKSASLALDYALALHADTGAPEVQVRAGIHTGSIDVEESDVFGSEVNFAARVVGKIAGAEIWLSERAMNDLKVTGAKRHATLAWQPHEHLAMKGFNGDFALFSLQQM